MATPGDDMLGWLITAEAGGERLSRDEIHDILGLLIIAGLDTVAASLACFLSYFARHPEQRAKIVADPSGLAHGRRGVDAVRVAGHRRGTHRHSRTWSLPSGSKITAGTLMVMSWSAADLDPEYFPDPLTVDFEPVTQSAYRLRQRIPPLPGIPPGSHGNGRRHGNVASAHSELSHQAGSRAGL